MHIFRNKSRKISRLLLYIINHKQWCNQGAESPPPYEPSDREIFADVSGKKRQGKKEKGVKTENERKKIVKGKVENC